MSTTPAPVPAPEPDPAPAPAPAQKTQPVRNVMAAVTVLGVIVTALQAVNWADHPSWQSIAGTVVSALLAAFGGYMIKFLPAKVIPFIDALIYRDASGKNVAGPAAALPNGTPAQVVAVPPAGSTGA